MLMKLLKRAQANPGVVVRDKRTGIAVWAIDQNIAIVRNGEPVLKIDSGKLTYSNVKTSSELTAFQGILEAYGILDIKLFKGENNYLVNSLSFD